MEPGKDEDSQGYERVAKVMSAHVYTPLPPLKIACVCVVAETTQRVTKGFQSQSQVSVLSSISLKMQSLSVPSPLTKSVLAKIQ